MKKVENKRWQRNVLKKFKWFAINVVSVLFMGKKKKEQGSLVIIESSHQHNMTPRDKFFQLLGA